MGLSEEEWWGSTPAKIFALHEERQYLLRAADYFPAQLLASYLNAKGTKFLDGSPITGTALLNEHRPLPRAKKAQAAELSLMTPDRGAVGGEEIRSMLKKVTRGPKR